jgi:hypothetical protein
MILNTVGYKFKKNKTTVPLNGSIKTKQNTVSYP